uniref:Uncharacterized protein n=1 Tax=Oryza brachyantha TaxID=4533 RepID=J3N386_ORYBR
RSEPSSRPLLRIRNLTFLNRIPKKTREKKRSTDEPLPKEKELKFFCDRHSFDPIERGKRSDYGEVGKLGIYLAKKNTKIIK